MPLRCILWCGRLACTTKINEDFFANPYLIVSCNNFIASWKDRSERGNILLERKRVRLEFSKPGPELKRIQRTGIDPKGE